jgi:hypothetical protein
MLLRIFAILLLLGAACGSGNGSTTATNPEPEPSPTPPTTPTPTATPTPTPEPEPTPEPSPFVTVERLDAAAECDGILPATTPDPVLARLSPESAFACFTGTSDGTGAVVLGARDGAGNGWWRAFSADGTPRSSFAAWPLYPQPVGWQGAVTIPRTEASGIEGVAVLTFTPSGGLARRVEVVNYDPWVSMARWDLQQDPLGGSALFAEWNEYWSNPSWWTSVTRISASGDWLSQGGHGMMDLIAGGVSNRGDALAWSYYAGPLLHWVAPDGTTSASDYPSDAMLWLTPREEPRYLLPLLDGSLVLVENGAYTLRFSHLSLAREDPPAWLTSRVGWTFRFTRGNRGYAAFEPAGRSAPECTQRIEFVSLGGRLCGRITLREDAADCVTGSVDQGWDGTVVQQSGQDACSFRWWPGLLAGD